MPAVGTLIMYGAMAVAFLSFVAWGNSVVGHHYTDPLIAEQKAKDLSFKTTIAADEVTIRSQGSSLALCMKTTGEQNASLTRMTDIAKARGDEADALKLKLAQRRASVQPKIDADAAAAAGPPSAGTCEQQAANIRQMGDEYAREVLGVK